MKQYIAQVALVVHDYDQAIDFYVNKLGFDLIEDTQLSDIKRWVLVSPPGSRECKLLLVKAANERQSASVANQTGGRVFLFLYTDNFERDFNKYSANGVKFVRQPTRESYGTVAVFEDLYGNLWDLVEPSMKY